MGKTVVKKTISLQPDVWDFISREANKNVSGFVNRVIRAHRRQALEKALMEGYQAMAADKNLAEDLRLWDSALLDGLEDEDR